MPKALIVHGGWRGHQPDRTTAMAAEHLSGLGWTVTTRDTLEAFDDAAFLAEQDLIVPNWTMGRITEEQERNLVAAVEGGVGMAGWHGGMGDAFRASLGYTMVVGGVFVAHPGGVRPYTVQIVDRRDPVTQGLDDFAVTSEQYYMHVAPGSHVLATTTFDRDELAGVAGVTMPVAWKRRWGQGRVFYVAVGHTPEDLAIPEVWTMLTRGMAWAARPGPPT